MCAVTLETVYTVADVLPVMAVVKGFAAPNLLELAILHLLSLAVPLLTFHCGYASGVPHQSSVGAMMLWNPDSQRMCSDLSDATEEDYELHCSFSLALAVLTAERWR